MTVSEWTPGTNFYLIHDKIMLQSIINEQVKTFMGYDPEKEYTFKDVCFQLKYVDGDKIICNIQLNNKIYIDINCVAAHITKSDFGSAKQMYGIDEFLTENTYKSYVPVMVENPDFDVNDPNSQEFIEKTDVDGNILHAIPD